MRSLLFFVFLSLLSAPAVFGQQGLWQWSHPYYYTGGAGRPVARGEVTSAACLDSVVVASWFRDTLFSVPYSSQYGMTIFNYRGQVVREILEQRSSSDAESMRRLSDTSFVVVASYYDSIYGGPLYALNARAYGQSGKPLWRHTFGQAGHSSYFFALDAVAEGGLDVIYFYYDPAIADYRSVYCRLDPAGQTLFERDLTAYAVAYPGELLRRPNMQGFSVDDTINVGGRRQFQIFRTDFDLSQTTTDTVDFGSQPMDNPNDRITLTGDDGLVVYTFGPKNAPNNQNRYVRLTRFDAHLRYMWTKIWQSTYINFEPLADGGLLVRQDSATTFRSNGTYLTMDHSLCRYDINGNKLWQFSTAQDDSLRGGGGGIAFDGRNGGILYGALTAIDGSNSGGGPWIGYFTNLGRPLDPTPVQQALAGDAAVLRVWPNPAKAGGTLRYKLPKGQAKGRLTLMGIDGKLLLEIDAEKEGQILLPALPPGLYLLQGQGAACRIVIE